MCHLTFKNVSWHRSIAVLIRKQWKKTTAKKLWGKFFPSTAHPMSKRIWLTQNVLKFWCQIILKILKIYFYESSDLFKSVVFSPFLVFLLWAPIWAFFERYWALFCSNHLVTLPVNETLVHLVVNWILFFRWPATRRSSKTTHQTVPKKESYHQRSL